MVTPHERRGLPTAGTLVAIGTAAREGRGGRCGSPFPRRSWAKPRSVHRRADRADRRPGSGGVVPVGAIVRPGADALGSQCLTDTPPQGPRQRLPGAGFVPDPTPGLSETTGGDPADEGRNAATSAPHGGRAQPPDFADAPPSVRGPALGARLRSAEGVARCR